MSCAFRVALLCPVVVSALGSGISQRAGQPGSVTKHISRPTLDDNASGDYERMTQAPMVWLNLRKTKLSLPSQVSVVNADEAIAIKHAAA